MCEILEQHIIKGLNHTLAAFNDKSILPGCSRALRPGVENIRQLLVGIDPQGDGIVAHGLGYARGFDMAVAAFAAPCALHVHLAQHLMHARVISFGAKPIRRSPERLFEPWTVRG